MMDINEESVVYEEIEVKEDFDHEILQLSLFLFIIFFVVLISSVKLDIFQKSKHNIPDSLNKRECNQFNFTSLSSITDYQNVKLIENLLRIHHQPLSLYIIGPSNKEDNLILIGKAISDQSTTLNQLNILRFNDHQFKEKFLSKINNDIKHDMNSFNGCYSNIFIILIDKSSIQFDDSNEYWKSNMEWLESAMDESKPVLHTHRQDFDTSNWGFIFIESIDHDIDNISNMNLKKNSVGKMVSDRWFQRISQTIIIR